MCNKLITKRNVQLRFAFSQWQESYVKALRSNDEALYKTIVSGFAATRAFEKDNDVLITHCALSICLYECHSACKPPDIFLAWGKKKGEKSAAVSIFVLHCVALGAKRSRGDHLPRRLTCTASLIHSAAAVIVPMMPVRLSKQECARAV